MKLTLKPKAPFDFNLSAGGFSAGDKQISKYEDGKYWRVVRLNNTPALLIVSALGNADEPELLIELKANETITNQDEEKAWGIIKSMFNPELELEHFYQVVKNDEILAQITDKLRGLQRLGTPTIFEALVNSIIEQQISLKVARSMETKMIKSFGDVLKLGNETYYAYPTPQQLASATTEQFRQCGLSFKKIEYIQEISRLVADKTLDLDKFKEYENETEIINELIKIRGIGVWTAELTILRGMNKLNVVPADDLGLRRYVSHYYCDDGKISGEELRRIAKKWGKWRGLAAFYVVMAARLGVEIN